MPTSRGRLLRDNAFLVGAVALPLAVVLFFVLFTSIPRWTVEPPRHDLLLHARSWDQTGPRITVDFTVLEGTLRATVRPQAANASPQRSTLWLFDHRDLSVREVPLPLPEKLEAGEAARTIVVEALGGRRVVAQTTAPDGYEVQTRSSSSPGFIGDLFGMRRYDRAVTVVRRGRVIPIRVPSLQSYEHPDFVGWLIDE